MINDACEVKTSGYISKLPWSKLQRALSLVTTSAVSAHMLGVASQEVRGSLPQGEYTDNPSESSGATRATCSNHARLTVMLEKHKGEITLSGYEVQYDLRFFWLDWVDLAGGFCTLWSCTSMQSLGSKCEENYPFLGLPVALASCPPGKTQKILLLVVDFDSVLSANEKGLLGRI